MILGELEKDHFVALLHECAEFCDIDLLTYSVMSNHFHVLVEVPHRPLVLPTAGQMVERLRKLSGHQDPGAVEQLFAAYEAAGDVAGAEALLAKLHARLWDLSRFMQLVKQRFTQWYNRRTGRKGTLWEERFKSVVVEGGAAVAAVAAYIDLNPVRAGLVSDPKEYRWSGYGAAMGGERGAQEGLQKVITGLRGGVEEGLERSMELYQMQLYNVGSEERESLDAEGRLKRGALKRDAVLAVLQNRGRLPLKDYLRCRVRYFCDGAVLGSREFAEDMFARYRDRFGPKRKDGARRMRGLADWNLFTLRDLRLNVFG
jgi:REP element-mobilizing transposase RayT